MANEETDTTTVGSRAPVFNDLMGVDGKVYSMSTFDEKRMLVIIFMANRCVTAEAYTSRIEGIQQDYGDKGVQVVAINSDDPSLLPAESYQEMVRVAKERGYTFPYLKDEGRSVATSYGAELTVDAFLLDRDRKIRYRGRIDNSPNPAFVTFQRSQERVGRCVGKQRGEGQGDRATSVRYR